MSGIGRLLLRARTNAAKTDGAEPYPDLAPLTIDLPPNAAYTAALSAARAMPLWQVTSEDPAAGRITACATTPRMKFVDDVNVTVDPWGSGSRIHVRSASRVGISDFGTNARRIRAYLARLATNSPR